jgi:hypothetical protein
VYLDVLKGFLKQNLFGHFIDAQKWPKRAKSGANEVFFWTFVLSFSVVYEGNDLILGD